MAPKLATTEAITLLVVEDDRALAVGLDLNLTADGYRVLVAGDGETALRLAVDETPNLVLLDLNLPDMDGILVLNQLRQRDQDMPVIILSARSEEKDKITGLDVGADDYVTKPFGLNELTARIRATLRRAGLSQKKEATATIGEVEIELETRRVFRAGTEIQLTAREFDLLAFFVKHRGRTHTRERLLSAVWGYDYEGTSRTVDNFVRSLRVKLEADPTQPKFFVTVHGLGYRLEASG